MRKKENEITDIAEIEEILRGNCICRIAMNGKDYPYIVPVNYGYLENAIYIHSAREGMKIDLLKNDNRLCFEVSGNIKIQSSSVACSFGTRYRSVIGFGRVVFLEKSSAIREGLDVIMEQHRRVQPGIIQEALDFPGQEKNAAGKTGTPMFREDGSWNYSESSLNRVMVWRIDIDSCTGKTSGDN